MKKYIVFIGIVVIEIVIFLGLLLYGIDKVSEKKAELNTLRQLAHELRLTDFSIWTEARYTRHPSQADWFSAFQDYPSSVEHFPAGSIIPPPELILKEGGS
ncbi:MAG: hypothetical protein GXO99_02330 [Nitrospirae bacterium]|nr:hypothetical protein [Nitrospirota bacterium]